MKNEQDSFELENRCCRYIQTKDIESVFADLLDKVMFHRPDDLMGFLLSQLKDHFMNTISFVMNVPFDMIKKEELWKIKNNFPEFEFIVCNEGTKIEEISEYLSKITGQHLQVFIINYPSTVYQYCDLKKSNIFYRFIFSLDKSLIQQEYGFAETLLNNIRYIQSSHLYSGLKVCSKESTIS